MMDGIHNVSVRMNVIALIAHVNTRDHVLKVRAIGSNSPRDRSRTSIFNLTTQETMNTFLEPNAHKRVISHGVFHALVAPMGATSRSLNGGITSIGVVVLDTLQETLEPA